jgi:hypothetical protein
MVFIGGVLVLGNLIAMKKANDYGRREAILFASIPMALTQSILAVVVAYNQLSENPEGFYWGGWISILCMSLFMFFCAIGFATQPWTICTEIFPQELKGTALSFCMLASWGFNYVTASWFP